MDPTATSSVVDSITGALVPIGAIALAVIIVLVALKVFRWVRSASVDEVPSMEDFSDAEMADLDHMDQSEIEAFANENGYIACFACDTFNFDDRETCVNCNEALQ